MEFLPTIAGRIRDDPEPLAWDPINGGWVNKDPAGAHINTNNRNLHNPTAPDKQEFRTSLDPEAGANGGYGFGGRAPVAAGMGAYRVKDKSSETYAYSGARGIFSQAKPYVPDYYALGPKEYKRPDSAPGTKMAPGTSVPLKGGWPTAATYGELPSRTGWSIEGSARATNPHWVSRANA